MRNPVWWNGDEIVPTLTVKSADQRMPDKGQLFALIQYLEETKEGQDAQHQPEPA
jgi:hypothetical protein